MSAGKLNPHSSEHWHLNARKTAVYRLYGADDQLLYVGITVNPKVRLADHEQAKFWWHLVTRTDVQWFDSRPLAEAAEGTAIRDERPRYDATERLGSGWRRVQKQDDPFWSAAAEALAARIEAGEYEVGSKLPATRALAAEFGVSICSMHTAYRWLESNLLVRAHNGVRYPLQRQGAARWPVQPAGSDFYAD
jgi:predicted GIY-YIG superfamily endonuclease